MTTTVASVAPSTAIPDVAAILYTAAVRAPPVLDHGALLGVVSEADLLTAIAAAERPERPVVAAPAHPSRRSRTTPRCPHRRRAD